MANSSANLVVTIGNLSGQNVAELFNGNSKTLEGRKLNIGPLSNGTYTLNIFGSQGLTYHKLITILH